MTELTARSAPPVLLSVDDDTQVLDAVAADLRAHYGSRYRIRIAASGAEALATIERMTRVASSSPSSSPTSACRA